MVYSHATNVSLSQTCSGMVRGSTAFVAVTHTSLCSSSSYPTLQEWAAIKLGRPFLRVLDLTYSRQGLSDDPASASARTGF